MFWLLGVFTAYVLVGTFIAWALETAGGKKFAFTKESIPFILTWPKLVLAVVLTNWKH